MRLIVQSILLITALIVFIDLSAQFEDEAAAFLARAEDFSRRMEARGLADPFSGITSDGDIEPGLFSIRSTGVSTAPVRRSAEAFLSLLSEEQRGRTRSVRALCRAGSGHE